MFFVQRTNQLSKKHTPFFLEQFWFLLAQPTALILCFCRNFLSENRFTLFRNCSRSKNKI